MASTASLQRRFRFGRQATFVASCVQAVVSLATFLLVNNLVPAVDYARFSNALALSVWVNTLLFEWARIAASRFFHQDDARDGAGAAVFNALIFGQIGATAIAIVGAVAAWATGLIAAGPAAACVVIAWAQGAGDVLLAMLRMSGNHRIFSTAALIRVFCLMAVTVGIAGWTHHAEPALMGYAATAAVFVITLYTVQRRFYRVDPALFGWSQLIGFLRYGGLAGAASMIHQLSVLCLRWQAMSALPPANAAAVAIALDMFLRPFSVLAFAINGAMMPDAVREEEAAASRRPQLTLLLRLHLWMAMLGFAGLSAGGWVLASYLAQTASRPFLQSHYVLLLVFCLSTVLVQAVAAVPVQLRNRNGQLVLTALVQLLIVAGASAGMIALGRADLLPAAAAIAGVAALLFGSRQFRLIPDGWLVREWASAGVIMLVAASIAISALDAWISAAITALVASVWLLFAGRALLIAHRRPEPA